MCQSTLLSPVMSPRERLLHARVRDLALVELARSCSSSQPLFSNVPLACVATMVLPESRTCVPHTCTRGSLGTETSRPSAAVVLPGSARCAACRHPARPSRTRRRERSSRAGSVCASVNSTSYALGIDRDERALDDVAASRSARGEPRVPVDGIRGRARARVRRTAPNRRSTPARPAACSGSSRPPARAPSVSHSSSSTIVSFAPATLPSELLREVHRVGAVHSSRFGSSVAVGLQAVPDREGVEPARHPTSGYVRTAGPPGGSGHAAERGHVGVRLVVVGGVPAARRGGRAPSVP